MNNQYKYKFLKYTLITVLLYTWNFSITAQNVSVNNTDITTENENSTNVIILEDPGSNNQTTNDASSNTKGEVKNKDVQETETSKFIAEDLTSGGWTLKSVEAKQYNGINITKWDIRNNDVTANCSWKDMLEIVHTIESGFKWQDPPEYMKPGEYLNLEAIYTNIDYSTTANISTGIKMFFGKAGSDYKNPEANSIEVLKLTKSNKQYANEVKKGFFYAPKTYFDKNNLCQLIIDCYVGKDHYVTTYTYEYTP
ncbi:MAG: hypothetical protein IT280_11220 [Ignavibacteria bacterium]|nr:hypothetical protein [Ignavibacteria bacterium]